MRFWNLALCTRKTVLGVTVRADAEEHPSRLPMRLNQLGIPSEAKSPIRLTASRATVPEVAADRRAAPLRMIRFSRWLAIRGCARLSSPGVPNWERQTGGEMCSVNLCQTRK